MDIVSSLLDIEQELTLYVFNAVPETEDDQASLGQVVALRERLRASVNEIVLYQAQLAALGLPAQAKSLDGLLARLRATTKSMEKAQEVIGTITEVLGVATSIAVGLIPGK